MIFHLLTTKFYLYYLIIFYLHLNFERFLFIKLKFKNEFKNNFNTKVQQFELHNY